MTSVEADIDILAGRLAAGAFVGLHVEADDEAVGGDGQHHVGLVDVADAAVNDPYLNLVGAQVLQLAPYRLDAALNIGLENDIQLFHLAGVNLVVKVLQGDAVAGRFRLGVGLLLGQYRLRFTLVGHGLQRIAHLGDTVKTENFRRRRRLGLLEALAGVVEHGSDTAPCIADDDSIAFLEGAVLHQHSGQRPPGSCPSRPR